MKCVEIRELLSLYIDKMLDESEIREVEKHLSACEACRKEYNEIKEIVDLLGRAEMVPVPDAFGFRLKQALKEEKQNMIRTGILKGFSKKKRWRLISSLAAVFAVGILSFGLFHDIIGDLPNRNAGMEQADMASPEDSYGAYSDRAGEADSGIDSASSGVDSAGSAEMYVDDSVPEENQSSDLKPMVKAQEPAALNGAQSDSPESPYGSVGSAGSAGSDDTVDTAGGGSEPYPGDESGKAAVREEDSSAAATGQEADGQEAATRKAIGEPEAAKEDLPTTDSAAEELVTLSDSGGAADPDQEIQEYGGTMPVPGEGSRSTGPGVERSPLTIEHYNALIEEKLNNFDYQILSTDFELTGQWKFRIFIFRDKDGNTYNEEITIIGKDGEIKTVTANELMGL